MKTGIIYIVTNKINNKYYIGQTIKNLNERRRNHKKDTKRKKTHFYNAILKYGWDNFTWKTIYHNIPFQQLNNMEIWCIANYNTYYNGYNSTLGGDDNPMNNPESRRKSSLTQRGKILSEEHKNKISKGISGKNNPMANPKNRLKLSKLRKGNKNPFYGKQHTNEIMCKIIEANSKSYEITDPENSVFIIKNLAKFCRDNSLSPGCMYDVINKKRKSHRGYSCKKVR